MPAQIVVRNWVFDVLDAHVPIKPSVELLRSQDHWHAVVYLSHVAIGLSDNHTFHKSLARSPMVIVGATQRVVSAVVTRQMLPSSPFKVRLTDKLIAAF